MDNSKPGYKPMGFVVKQGRDVISFEITPTDERIKFLQALADVVEGRKAYPTGCDVITYAVRIATGNDSFEFPDDPAGRKLRSGWKTLAFPILYGMRSLSKLNGAHVKREHQELVSPTGRKLSEPEAQFIPLSWLRSKPNRPQGKK